MDKVRVGLVGYGRFGKVHASAISLVPDAELNCVCVSNKERAEELKKSLAVEVYGDYTEFLEKGKMDVVDIVSPNYLHANQAIKAMQSGRDVLLEKPIAISMDEAMQIMEEQKKSSRMIHVGLEGRYTPFMKAFKACLEDGTLVNPAFAKIESWRFPFRGGAGGWRYDGARVGHQLLEEAIHFFDAAVWFFGMPETVWGFTDSPKTWDQGTFATAVAVLEYPHLKVMILDSLAGTGEHLMVSMTGEGAVIGMTESEVDGSSTAWVKKKDRTGTAVSENVEAVGERESVALEMRDLIERLRAGKEPYVTLADGVRALSLDLAAISAIGSGSRVAPYGRRA